jgi:hypothetical protein
LQSSANPLPDRQPFVKIPWTHVLFAMMYRRVGFADPDDICGFPSVIGVPVTAVPRNIAVSGSSVCLSSLLQRSTTSLPTTNGGLRRHG